MLRPLSFCRAAAAHDAYVSKLQLLHEERLEQLTARHEADAKHWVSGRGAAGFVGCNVFPLACLCCAGCADVVSLLSSSCMQTALPLVVAYAAPQLLLLVGHPLQAELRAKLEYNLHFKDREVEELSGKVHRLDAALRVRGCGMCFGSMACCTTGRFITSGLCICIEWLKTLGPS